MPINTPSEPTWIAFGGTFDPPHLGHVGCIAAALARFPAATIGILPAAQPPSAAGQSKIVASSFEHRLAMAKLAFAGLGPRVQILTLEQDLPRPNYTSNTLHHLAHHYPQQRLACLLGQDQWEALPRWHEPLKIIELADLVIVARPCTQDLPQVTAQTMAALGMPLASGALPAAVPLGSSGHRVHFITTTSNPAASSVARRTIAQSSPSHTADGWLSAAVLSYIDQHQLYSPSKDQP